VTALRTWARTRQQQLEEARTARPSIDAALLARTRDNTVAGNLLASAIAYRLFLWLLPVALLLSAGLGFVEAADREGGAESVGEDLGFGRSLVTVVADAAEQAERSRWVLLLLALFGIYVAGAAGARTFAAVHRLVWGEAPEVDRTGPLGSLAFTGAAACTIALSLGAGYLRRESPGAGLTVTLVIVAAYAGLWLGVSLALPHGDAPWTRLVPGALVVGVGTQLLHLLTVYYLSGRLESASELYGGLGTAATVLLGLYLIGRLVVAAALANAVLWKREAWKAEITRQG
jgi:uncharacterized BrkB/YihY/UPF0761 family membrane protein